MTGVHGVSRGLHGGECHVAERDDVGSPAGRSASSARRASRPSVIGGLWRTAAALLAFAVCSPVPAEEPAADPLKALTEQYQRDRRRVIAENLTLTEAEAKRFWPLYERYERDLFALTEKRRALIGEFAENYDAMTDDMARKIMLDRVQLEIERGQLRRRYVPKFEKVLPVKKLARYYQIESKIRAAVEAGIAEEIPLIK